jgi:hypothetical protein
LASFAPDVFFEDLSGEVLSEDRAAIAAEVAGEYSYARELKRTEL